MKTFDINIEAPKHNPFIVPEGYFAQFADDMMAKISSMQMRPARVRQREMRIVRWIPMLGAASVAALAVLFTQVASPASVGLDAATAIEMSQQAAMANEDAAYDYLMMADAENFTNYDAEY